MLTQSVDRRTPYQLRVVKALDGSSDIPAIVSRLLTMGYPMYISPGKDGAAAIKVYCRDRQDYAAADRLLEEIKL